MRQFVNSQPRCIVQCACVTHDLMPLSLPWVAKMPIYTLVFQPVTGLIFVVLTDSILYQF